MKTLLTSGSFSGNDSQGSDNDPNCSELELDDGGDSDAESDTPAESEAMNEVREHMDNMDIDEGEERNNPPENSA